MSAALPMELAGHGPSQNVTVPVAGESALDDTNAVNVALEPKTTVVGDADSIVVEATVATFNVFGLDVLVELFPSPLYFAVSECAPTVAKDVVVSCALPPESGAGVTALIAAPLSKNVTLPDGDAPVTVAVNCTVCPGAAALRESVRTVALTPVPMLCEIDPTLAVLLPSPLYVAVIVCDPVLSDDVDVCATPPESGILPSDVEVVASANAMLPVGCTPLLVTVAVNVTF